MPVFDIREDHTIRVVFRGFVITEIREGTGQIVNIYALNTSVSECHRPKVSALKINSETGALQQEYHGFDLNKDFSISATKSTKEIQVFWKDRRPFVRFDIHNDPKDFRWFVNLNEVHGLTGTGTNQVTLKPSIPPPPPLSPIFTIDDGLFHTSDRSDAEGRRVHIEEPGNPDEAFGRFALEVTARIYLDGSETADFSNGSRIFTANSRAVDHSVYEITYDCRCPINENESDFKLIYQAIDLPPGTKKIDIVADELLVDENLSAKPSPPPGVPLIRPASPETYCIGGFFP